MISVRHRNKDLVNTNDIFGGKANINVITDCGNNNFGILLVW